MENTPEELKGQIRNINEKIAIISNEIEALKEFCQDLVTPFKLEATGPVTEKRGIITDCHCKREFVRTCKRCGFKSSAVRYSRGFKGWLCIDRQACTGRLA